MNVVVVGLGGIGTHLVEPLCRTILFAESDQVTRRVVLIDGDAYQERNRVRQRYTRAANKAEATKEWLQPLFPELVIEAKSHFVDAENIYLFIREGDAVFLCVDNHATRKMACDYAQVLTDVFVVSGGNEEYDGNVQIYERRAGEDCTPPLTWLHPEIASPQDRNPAELSCEELATEGAPQVLAVNVTIAALMLNAFALKLRTGTLPYHEIYFDLRTGNVRPVAVDVSD